MAAHYHEGLPEAEKKDWSWTAGSSDCRGFVSDANPALVLVPAPDHQVPLGGSAAAALPIGPLPNGGQSGPAPNTPFGNRFDDDRSVRFLLVQIESGPTSAKNTSFIRAGLGSSGDRLVRFSYLPPVVRGSTTPAKSFLRNDNSLL